MISHVNYNLNKNELIRQLEGLKRKLCHQMSIIDHALNKYDMLFCTYLDLLPLNLVYFVLEMVIFSWECPGK